MKNLIVLFVLLVLPVSGIAQGTRKLVETTRSAAFAADGPSSLHYYAGGVLLGRIAPDGTLVVTAPHEEDAESQEKVVLTVPVFVSAGATEFRVGALTLRRTHPDRPAGVVATFREVNGSGFVSGGRTLDCFYGGDEADSLIVALNKANLSTTSLEKRVMQRCQADGKLGAGTIVGTPQ